MLVAEVQLQLIHFLTQKVHLCFEIQYIEKIIPLIEIQQYPNSTPYFVGLINISGVSVPVIDLAIRLGLRRPERYSLSTPIILCNDNSRQIGIIVDEVLGLATVDKKKLQMQNRLTDPESPFKAVISIEGKLALLLKIQKILSTNLNQAGKNQSIPFDIHSMNLTEFKHE